MGWGVILLRYTCRLLMNYDTLLLRIFVRVFFGLVNGDACGGLSGDAYTTIHSHSRPGCTCTQSIIQLPLTLKAHSQPKYQSVSQQVPYHSPRPLTLQHPTPSTNQTTQPHSNTHPSISTYHPPIHPPIQSPSIHPSIHPSTHPSSSSHSPPPAPHHHHHHHKSIQPQHLPPSLPIMSGPCICICVCVCAPYVSTFVRLPVRRAVRLAAWLGVWVVKR